MVTSSLVISGETLFDFLYSDGKLSHEVIQAQFKRDIDPLLLQTTDYIQILEADYVQMKNHGEIGNYVYRVGALWPLILCIALSMKIALYEV